MKGFVFFRSLFPFTVRVSVLVVVGRCALQVEGRGSGAQEENPHKTVFVFVLGLADA